MLVYTKTGSIDVIADVISPHLNYIGQMEFRRHAPHGEGMNSEETVKSEDSGRSGALQSSVRGSLDVTKDVHLPTNAV